MYWKLFILGRPKCSQDVVLFYGANWEGIFTLIASVLQRLKEHFTNMQLLTVPSADNRFWSHIKLGSLVQSESKLDRGAL